MKPVLRKGKLTTWKDDRGFGFIEPSAGTQEIFLHISAFRDLNRRPQVGDMICYQLAVEQNGKLRACNASIEGMISKPLPQSSSSSTAKPLRSQPTVKSSSLVFETLILALLPGLGSIHFLLTTGIPIPLILYPCMSLITLALYADDKSRAKKRLWRVPEKTLHLCEFMGGWLGAFVAQRKLHHKSSKASYQVEFRMIVIFHFGFWFVWLLFSRTLITIFLDSASGR